MKRIQCNKKEELSKNTVYIGDKSIYRNPFRIIRYSDHTYGIKINTNNELMSGILTDNCHFNYYNKKAAILDSIQCFKIYMLYIQMDLSSLIGKHLACDCPIEDPCHGDLLIDEAKRLQKNIQRKNREKL